MIKKAFNILIYISILFLAYYLYKLDYFAFGAISFKPFYLVASILLVLASFLMQSAAWWKALRVHGFEPGLDEAVISHGQAIFGKYIPGKVWVILGRAGYVARQRGEFKTTSFISLKEQLIYIWVGLVVSAVPTFIFYGFKWMSLLVIMITLLLSLLLFSQGINRFGLKLFERVFRRSLDIPIIDFRSSLSIILYELVFWTLISGAFLLFVAAVTPEVRLIMAFAYPLSVSLGVLAIILPGGLGVREGILTGFLVLAGMDLTTATTLSVAGRFWYMLGEVFLFIVASVLRLRKKRKRD